MKKLFQNISHTGNLIFYAPPKREGRLFKMLSKSYRTASESSKPYFSLVSEYQQALDRKKVSPLSIPMETYPVPGPVKPSDGEAVIVGTSLRGSWDKAVYSVAEDCYRGPGG